MQNGDQEIVNLLVDYQADINSPNYRRVTPLAVACKRQDWQMVNHLLDKKVRKKLQSQSRLLILTRLRFFMVAAFDLRKGSFQNLVVVMRGKKVRCRDMPSPARRKSQGRAYATEWAPPTSLGSLLCVQLVTCARKAFLFPNLRLKKLAPSNNAPFFIHPTHGLALNRRE